jgi:DNA polymerase III alpha subunit
MNWRFQYTFTEEEIFELIKKMDKPGLDKKLVETSPEELKSLSLTYYTGTKKEFLNTLSEKKKTYIERLEYELVVIHEM